MNTSTSFYTFIENEKTVLSTYQSVKRGTKYLSNEFFAFINHFDHEQREIAKKIVNKQIRRALFFGIDQKTVLSNACLAIAMAHKKYGNKLQAINLHGYAKAYILRSYFSKTRKRRKNEISIDSSEIDIHASPNTKITIDMVFDELSLNEKKFFELYYIQEISMRQISEFKQNEKYEMKKNIQDKTRRLYELFSE